MKIDNTNVYEMGIIRDAYQKAKASEGEEFSKILDRVKTEKDKEKLKEACRDLEAVFVGMVFERMRSTVWREGLIPESYGEKIFQSMLDEELAKKASSGEGLGISRMLYEQLVHAIGDASQSAARTADEKLDE
ncbi:MAG: Flagellar protein FlgJ [peptidoglycan hydrolase] [Firmicutes bacterium]|nr:Flagellar protein FlgJ [peptidoglycan hydrolase] [Bacillota bacterium]MDI6706391.1 rod-binding protein [Bacillota bacterium]